MHAEVKMHPLRARFSLSLVALMLLVGPTWAQWSLTTLPTPPPGPSVRLYGDGILDSGRKLWFGSNTEAQAIDPSGQNVYGVVRQGNTAVNTLGVWNASGFQTIPTASSIDAIGGGFYYATDSIAYGAVYNADFVSRAIAVTNGTVTDLTPSFASSSFQNGFNGNLASGSVSTGTLTQAYVWNGTSSSVNLHEGNGFAAGVSTEARATSGNRTAGNTIVASADPELPGVTNALLWNGTAATNLHTTGGVDALGYSSSIAQYLVGDYVLGTAYNYDIGTSTSLIWVNGQAQELSAFLGAPGAQLSSVDALGNLSLYNLDTGDNLYYAYQPSAGQSIVQGYAGPYFGSGFGGTNTLVYENDFESNANGFNTNQISREQVGSSRDGEGNPVEPMRTNALGRFSTEAVTLSLDNLTPGDTYSVTASLILGGTWDGGADIWTVSADGNIIFSESYFFQQRGELPRMIGFGPDLSNDFGYTRERAAPFQFIAQSTTATLLFQAPNLEPVTNEWWNLDNVQVTSRGQARIPEPGSLALVLLAPLGLLLCKRR